jgi:hypothetical protein
VTLQTTDRAVDVLNATWLARLRAWEAMREPTSVIAETAVEALAVIAQRQTERLNGEATEHHART